MFEGSYGKEPFDLRLTVLRMVRQWKRIAAVTLAGTLLVTGIYCLDNILLKGDTQYRAVSVYRLEYGVDPADTNLVMINSYTWDTYMHTEEFLSFVRSRLAGSGFEGLSDEELEGYIQGDMESDWRVPSTIVTTGDAAMSTAIAEAVEEAVILDFSKGISEIKEIRVIDHGEAEEVPPDLRIGRAAVLGAVLTLFFAIIVLLLKELGEDSIWLPAAIGRRYGLKTAGTPESRELKENISYLFSEKKQAVFCMVQEECEPTVTADTLKRICKDSDAENMDWLVVPSLLSCPEEVEKLKAADGVLLGVKAGAHAGKQLEYVLEFLKQQDCKVTCVILMEADELLLRWYYGFKNKRVKA